MDSSKLRKRVHAQLDEYPCAMPPKQRERPKDGRRFRSPAGTFSDDDGSPKRAKRGNVPTMKIQSLRHAPSTVKPNQPKVSTIGDDEAGDDWSALRTFSTIPMDESRKPRPQTIPNDKKSAPRRCPSLYSFPHNAPNFRFVHPNFLRDDYSLSNLLATTIPPDMDIYQMGDTMATALGDKNPVGGGTVVWSSATIMSTLF